MHNEGTYRLKPEMQRSEGSLYYCRAVSILGLIKVFKV